ncbi:MAG: hypothetical protein INR71_03410 [Terriglobus roseus]|nr:hypothetical protein [Terriglobus roseus]
MAGALADSSAFVRRAPAHSNEHTVRDLLFPRQAATNSSSSMLLALPQVQTTLPPSPMLAETGWPTTNIELRWLWR